MSANASTDLHEIEPEIVLDSQDGPLEATLDDNPNTLAALFSFLDNDSAVGTAVVEYPESTDHPDDSDHSGSVAGIDWTVDRDMEQDHLYDLSTTQLLEEAATTLVQEIEGSVSEAARAAMVLQDLSGSGADAPPYFGPLRVNAPISDRRLKLLTDTADGSDTSTPTSKTPTTGSHSPPKAAAKVSQPIFRGFLKKTTDLIKDTIAAAVGSAAVGAAAEVVEPVAAVGEPSAAVERDEDIAMDEDNTAVERDGDAAMEGDGDAAMEATAVEDVDANGDVGMEGGEVEDGEVEEAAEDSAASESYASVDTDDDEEYAYCTSDDSSAAVSPSPQPPPSPRSPPPRSPPPRSPPHSPPPSRRRSPPHSRAPRVSTNGFVRHVAPHMFKPYRLHGKSSVQCFYLDGFEPADQAYYRKHGKIEASTRSGSRHSGGKRDRIKVWIRSYQVSWVGQTIRGYEPMRRIMSLWPDVYKKHRAFMKKVRSGETTDDEAGWSHFVRECRATPVLAANNETGTCLIDAIRVASRLLGQPGYASATRTRMVEENSFDGRFPPEGLTRQQLYDLVGGLNHISRTESEPILHVVSKRDNRIKGRVGGLIRVELEDGVYLALGVGHLEGPGHAFVLHVKDGVRHMHDPMEHDGPMAWHKNNFAWIRLWQYILKVTVRETYTTKQRKGRNQNRKKHRPERRRKKRMLNEIEGTVDTSDDDGGAQDTDEDDAMDNEEMEEKIP